ncbi:MAG: toll/interleukin-1 receptor domain-containing protein [Chloroflexi bacterium]|nr:toll/interleukin-1 receptor domain-containing protein [Chloroflexota bacterium]
MNDQFQFDVFLSHSSKDKAVVRAVADRLRSDGLKVWFDGWVLRPGDSIPAKIEDGLDHSRVLVPCMSANPFGSNWTQLEAGTFRFRDPLNKERRFIPVRLDDASVKGSLAQFLHINWLLADREQEYAKLLEACRPPAKPEVAEETKAAGEQLA